MSKKRLHNPRIKIGISSCLLGQAVRYDGGHKRHSFIINKLRQYFDCVPICPEVGIGMPVPRPPIQLVKRDEGIRVLDARTHSRDYTDALNHYPRLINDKIEPLCGYILKKNSPSCGVEGVAIFPEENNKLPLEQKTSGMFAQSLRKHFPLLPMAEEGRLCDPTGRKNFIWQILVYHRWRVMLEKNMQQKDLLEFHASITLMMGYNREMTRKLRQVVVRAGSVNFESVKLEYITTLMQLLEKNNCWPQA